MKIKLYCAHVTEIPARKVRKLEADVREKYELEKDAEVALEDLVIEAHAQGVIDLPDEDFKDAREI